MKLKTRREPYWVKIHQGLAVGYRKGARGGFWIGRLYDEDYKNCGYADLWFTERDRMLKAG